MNSVLLDNTRWFLPVVLNYKGTELFKAKIYGTGWSHKAYDNSNGRHPFNVVTEEIYGD